MSVSKRRWQKVWRSMNVHRYLAGLVADGRLTQQQVDEYYERVGR